MEAEQSDICSKCVSRRDMIARAQRKSGTVCDAASEVTQGRAAR